MSPLFLLAIFAAVINGKKQRELPRLTFLGDDLATKRQLLDIPIIRLNNAPNDVSLTIPSTLTTPNGVQNIEITWSNAVNGGSSDWIGIYSPTNSSDNQYLDYFHTDGVVWGEYQARVWNMRDNYEIRYFTYDGSNAYVLKGTSNIATISPNQPLQAHISVTKNSPNEIQIRWVSSLVSNPTVQIGIKSGLYTQSFTATYYTYNTSTMCGSTASIISPTQFRDPGYIYTAIANKLTPDTTYYYIFGNKDYWSTEYSFTTGSDDYTKAFQFVMFGDMGTYTNSYAVIKNIESVMDDTDLVLHVGDISYAWGNGYTWEIFSNMVANIAGSAPYMISIGNHEYDHTSPCNNGGNDVSGVGGTGYHPPWGNMGDDSSGECGAPMYYRYKAEINNENDNQNSIFWYSFNYNMVHFLMLSSEHDYTSSAPGYQFILNDLRNVNSTETPWIIATIHRSLYESEIYSGDNEVSIHLIEELEPVFYKYNVDMVLSGHFHSYERTCAVYNYTCVGESNGGITHITIGTGGIGLDNALYQKEDWSVFRDEINYGFGKFNVNYTALNVQFITNDIGVVDEITLKK